MADRILVVAEQREGKLNRVSLETLAAAQAIGNETGWTVAVGLPAVRPRHLAQELAGYKVEKVYDLEAASLAAYTSDAYVAALKHFIRANSRSWCCCRIPTRCATSLPSWRSPWIAR